MSTDEKFNEFYQTIINKNADDLEIARREAQAERKRNYTIILTLIFINIIIIFIFSKILNPIFNEKLGSFATICILISSLIYLIIKPKDPYSKRINYTRLFKTNVIGAMIKTFEENLKFSPHNRYFSIKL